MQAARTVTSSRWHIVEHRPSHQTSPSVPRGIEGEEETELTRVMYCPKFSVTKTAHFLTELGRLNLECTIKALCSYFHFQLEDRQGWERETCIPGIRNFSLLSLYLQAVLSRVNHFFSVTIFVYFKWLKLPWECWCLSSNLLCLGIFLSAICILRCLPIRSLPSCYLVVKQS